MGGCDSRSSSSLLGLKLTELWEAGGVRMMGVQMQQEELLSETGGSWRLQIHV